MKMGYNSERGKKILGLFLIFFFRTSEPLSTIHSWVKGIHVYSKEWPRYLQSGDNHKNIKIGWGNSKIFISRATWPQNLTFT
jgi:hypothetical protein